MKKKYLVLITFVSCLLCLLYSGCEQQTAATPETESVAAPQPPGESKIMFEETTHDFGEVGPSTKNSCEFKFTNTGTGLLKIEKIKSTCGCTVPELAEKEYNPGESGSIKVKYRAPSRAATEQKRLYVHSNSKMSPKVILTVKATVVTKVEYEPERLKLSLREENAGCPDIVLTSLDNKPFAIKQTRSTLNTITVEYDVSTENTKFVLHPVVNMEKLRTNLRGSINFQLTHPQCKTVIIPYSTLAEFKVNPPTIMLLSAQPQKPLTRELWILNNYNDDFEIESTSSKEGIIEVLSQEKTDNAYKLKLQITPPAASTRKRIFSDTFYINIKDGEKLKVICRGFYKKEKLTPQAGKD